MKPEDKEEKQKKIDSIFAPPSREDMIDVMAHGAGNIGDKVMKGAKPLSSSSLSTFGWGALTAAQTYFLNKLLKVPARFTIPLTITSFGAGMLIPKVVNQVGNIANRPGHDPKESRDLIHSYLSKSPSEYMEKNSSASSVVASIMKPIAKGTAKTGKTLMKSLLPVAKTAPIGERALGIAGKGTLLGGSYYFGTQLGKPKVGSKRNYQTMLRNNILAKRLHISELTQPDQQSVLKLGMK